MSTNSVQFEKAYVTTPKSNLFPHELNGRIRSIFANIVVSEELSTVSGNIINLVKLPANAVISKLQMIVVSGSASAGVLELGYSAGERYEAADADAFAAGIDPTGAVNLELDLSSAAAGMLSLIHI